MPRRPGGHREDPGVSCVDFCTSAISKHLLGWIPHAPSPEASIDATGRGVSLVPCVFSGPDVLTLVDQYYRPTLAYAPAYRETLDFPPIFERHSKLP